MAFVIVSEAYRAPAYTELTVCENAVSMSGEGFHITDPAGQVLFKMDGHALSIRDRCTLRDRESRPILSARKKVWNLHKKTLNSTSPSSCFSALCFPQRRNPNFIEAEAIQV
jgi:hypothetical protein